MAIYASKSNGVDAVGQSGDVNKTMTSIRAQIADANKSTAITESTALHDIRWAKHLHHTRDMSLVLFIVAVVSLSFFVYWSISNLKRDYASAYHWWNSPIGYSNEETTPFPNGIYSHMTVPGLAVGAKYPPVAWVQGLFFDSSVPNRNGTLFLLTMASEYGFWVDGPLKGSVRLKGIHWNGSGDQLRLADMQKFLPIDVASMYGTGSGVDWGYVWASWNQKALGGDGYANPFAQVIWTDVTTFSRCPMVIGYYARQYRSMEFFTALFGGGLCSVAMDWFEADTKPEQIVDELFASVSVKRKKQCTTVQVASSAIQYGSLGFALGIQVALSFFAPPVAVMAGLFLAGSGAALGATVLKPDCGVERVVQSNPT